MIRTRLAWLAWLWYPPPWAPVQKPRRMTATPRPQPPPLVLCMTQSMDLAVVFLQFIVFSLTQQRWMLGKRNLGHRQQHKRSWISMCSCGCCALQARQPQVTPTRMMHTLPPVTVVSRKFRVP